MQIPLLQIGSSGMSTYGLMAFLGLLISIGTGVAILFGLYLVLRILGGGGKKGRLSKGKVKGMFKKGRRSIYE